MLKPPFEVVAGLVCMTGVERGGKKDPFGQQSPS